MIPSWKTGVERPGLREGYDRWADTYDAVPNPLVALDRRVTPAAIAARPGEWALDAGCGTGFHLEALSRAGSRAVGLDLSAGMLRVARRAAPRAWLAQADLDRPFPVRRNGFDVVISALVSEHLKHPRRFFREAFAALRRGGRLVFSAFHPELARSGLEANFEDGGVEVRLGAERHTVDDYLGCIRDAGFRAIRWEEHRGDARLAEEVSAGRRCLGQPLLLLVRAERWAP